jgi:hypothetical protein
MMRSMRYLGAIVVVLLAGCGSSKDKTSGFAPDLSDGTGGGGSSGSLGSSGGNGGNSDCSEAAKLVYVVTSQNDLYSFHPANLMFVKIGPLACPAAMPQARPFSMAVDRNGMAWVNYDDGELFRVSTADASCAKTSYTPQNGFVTFGMGFSTDGPDAKTETLYVCGFQFNNGTETGLGLAKLDTKTLGLGMVGNFTGQLQGHCAELTGTGDAKLYGFFEGSPAQLAGIDKGNTATPAPRPLSGVQLTVGSAFAFSFWGGDFWFYTATGSNAGSSVTQFKASSDQSISVVRSNVGFTIVGAGVSTCAPTAPPK